MLERGRRLRRLRRHRRRRRLRRTRRSGPATNLDIWELGVPRLTTFKSLKNFHPSYFHIFAQLIPVGGNKTGLGKA